MDSAPLTSIEWLLRGRRLPRALAGLCSAAILAAAGVYAAGVATQSASATTSAAGDCTPGTDWGTVRADLASQTIQLVNAHRAGLGLRQLVLSSTLSASAVWKARHMALYSYMTHNDPAPPVARSTGERMAACGYGASWGENIAYGYTSAQSVVNGWLNSSGHRANIENSNWAAIGSGAAVSASGRIYWAHAFGSVADSGPPPPPTTTTTTTTTPPPPTTTTTTTTSTTTTTTTTTTPTSTTTTTQPAPSGPATSVSPVTLSAPAPSSRAAAGVVLRGLSVAHRPQAGRKLVSTVAILRRGKRVQTGRVFCRAAIDQNALPVLEHTIRRGKALCVWQIPSNARGELIEASVTVRLGQVRVRAPFRVRVS